MRFVPCIRDLYIHICRARQRRAATFFAQGTQFPPRLNEQNASREKRREAADRLLQPLLKPGVWGDGFVPPALLLALTGRCGAAAAQGGGAEDAGEQQGGAGGLWDIG
jgi:hypothetical protein